MLNKEDATLHKENSNPTEGSSQYFLGTMLSVGDTVTERT